METGKINLQRFHDSYSPNCLRNSCGLLTSIGKHVRDGITLAGACTVAAFVVVFAVIGALHATTGENGNPVIRFEATRDSNETNVRYPIRNFRLLQVEVVHFFRLGICFPGGSSMSFPARSTL